MSKWIIETDSRGSFETIRDFYDYQNFESNVFMNEGYVWVVGTDGKPLLVRSSEIVYAHEAEATK